MSEQKDRLKEAISDYDGPVDAWTRNQRALKTGGVGKDLMVSNCNGNRPISKKAAETYSRVFGRTPGWYLYGDEGAPPAAVTDPLKSAQKVRDTNDVRKLLKRIDGLTPANITVLVSAIEGFQQANGVQPSQNRPHDQSERASHPREVEPSR
ncbi:hypothetical protein [Pseudaminobacter sp. NGMCC 1.201702]|uniref:hypothetical protein n=1 Tax=Pseudaminobacter sp. NGMCC 1.201702 TaxID=3391825 RepID=UPI0039F1089E